MLVGDMVHREKSRGRPSVWQCRQLEWSCHFLWLLWQRRTSQQSLHLRDAQRRHKVIRPQHVCAMTTRTWLMTSVKVTKWFVKFCILTIHCFRCETKLRVFWRWFVYTVFQKTIGYPFYFCNNFFIRKPIFIIFGSNMYEEICNKTYIVFPPHLICVILLYLVTRAASLTNVHNGFLRTPFLQTF